MGLGADMPPLKPLDDLLQASAAIARDFGTAHD